MPDLLAVYERLESLLLQHTEGLKASRDFADANAASTSGKDAEPRRPVQGPEMMLLGAPSKRYPNGDCFAAVKLGKRYVSYYLMAMYVHPEVAESISPGLSARRQGKSCFNFTRIDEELFTELDALTARCHDAYASAGLLR